jgi:hypothetical protein
VTPIVSDPPLELLMPIRERLKTIWRFSMKTFVFGLGVGIAAVASVLIVQQYNSRPVPPHKWPEFTSGIMAVKIKTEWQDNAMQYIIVVGPTKTELESKFNKAAESLGKNPSFSLMLKDHGGFTIQECAIESAAFKSAPRNEKGEISQLVYEGSITTCSRTKYLRAAEADSVWDFPYVAANP